MCECVCVRVRDHASMSVRRKVCGGGSRGRREAAGAGGGLHRTSLRVLSLVLSGVQQIGVLNKH